MSLSEVLLFLVTFLKEKPIGKEYYVETTDRYDVSLFWSEPSLNLGWYPILQVDTDEKTVFWGEGTENPGYWYDLAVRAIEKLCE